MPGALGALLLEGSEGLFMPLSPLGLAHAIQVKFKVPAHLELIKKVPRCHGATVW